MRHELINDQKQRDSDENSNKNKLNIPAITLNYDSTVPKSTPIWRTKNAGRSLVFPEIKNCDAVSAIPLSTDDELLQIRSTKKSIRSIVDEKDSPPIVTINVSGNRFQTYLSTLEAYPNTLLGNARKRKYYWNSEAKEYFFDRHRACFQAILYYYQSNGRLRRPEFVPIDTFLEEIAFFELGPEASAQVRQVENIKDVEHVQMPKMIWRRYIWFYVEFPQHSHLARAINLISTLFTLLSCISLAIESLPSYTDHWDNICKEEANISLNATYVPRCSALFTSPFFIIQTICVAYFTIEFALRLISTPSYPRFILSFFNWVDLSAIVPYYVFLAIQLADQDIGLDTNAILCIRLLRVLRFSKIFKIYLVFKQLKSLRVLSATVKESVVDFIVMIIIITLVAFLFGAATYFVEQNENSTVFDSIPSATYWGIITMTGVGYGDMCPITVAGRIIGCLCALCGPATMGMLISVFVDRYQRVYNRKMYIAEPEISSVELDKMTNGDEDTKSVASSRRAGRRAELSRTISQQFSTFHSKMKPDQHQSYKFQFVLSFDKKKVEKDNDSTDRVITAMKKKLTEAISNTDIDVDLKLVDNDSQELWTISSSQVSSSVNSSFAVKTHEDDVTKQPKVEIF
ncbi:unnamed protein product [Adineta ricciae]|uniref:BTB domain-containing protein n=1 Tax=Adineta ricciae TaxID=249248 RepID=A0A813VF33_ADIRI|nr:unnamed protein product [Adineta ricciae]